MPVAGVSRYMSATDYRKLLFFLQTPCQNQYISRHKNTMLKIYPINPNQRKALHSLSRSSDILFLFLIFQPISANKKIGAESKILTFRTELLYYFSAIADAEFCATIVVPLIVSDTIFLSAMSNGST